MLRNGEKGEVREMGILMIKKDNHTWVPSDDFIKTTNIYKIMKELQIDSYQDFYAWSVKNYEEFWQLMTKILKIPFKKPFTQTLSTPQKDKQVYNWFSDGELNIADACFSFENFDNFSNSDSNDNGKNDHEKINSKKNKKNEKAILYRNEGETGLSYLTYNELNRLSNQVANSLVKMGVKAKDAVAVCMPMIPESVAIYLGIIKMGASVVSIADSFSPQEIQKRLQIAQSKVIFTMDHIVRGGKQLPLFEKIQSGQDTITIVLSALPKFNVSLRGQDSTWNDFLKGASDQFESVSCSPEHISNILFSSGTTSDPKAIPWTHTTPLKCAVVGFLHHNIKERDVVCWPTNIGWMMGPWLIYASLINRATIALYNGAPTGSDFGTFVQDTKVNMLGVVPSLVKAWKKTQCMEKLDWSSICAFSSTGECSNPEDMCYLMMLGGNKPIIEYCGGTEIGGGYITSTVVQTNVPSTFSTPALGSNFIILDEEGNKSQMGEVFLIPPSIGLSNTLLNKDHQKVYYEGCPVHSEAKHLRRHGDQIEVLEDGYFRAHGRVDDTMNLGGIKVSSAEIEQVLNTLKEVKETAAISYSNHGPSQLVIYAALFENEISSDSLKTKMQDIIKTRLNPLFKISDLIIVDQLPRTASNKVMRREIRSTYLSNSGG